MLAANTAGAMDLNRVNGSIATEAKITITNSNWVKVRGIHSKLTLRCCQ